ncbi:hypothetical protein J7K18_02915 [bacterium]|nr:hypothetical protein [bacterium]
MKRSLTIIVFLLAFASSGIADVPWEKQEKTEKGAASLWKGIGLSLLLPGAGERYLEDKNTSSTFFITEGTLWGFIVFSKVKADWLFEDMKSYAGVYAGAYLEGKNKDFFKNLAFYNSRDEYNRSKLVQERDLSALYPETDEYFWRWESEKHRNRYRNLRNRHEEQYRNIKIAFGVLAFERVISALNTYRIYRGYTKTEIKLSSKLDRGEASFTASLVHRF